MPCSSAEETGRNPSIPGLVRGPRAVIERVSAASVGDCGGCLRSTDPIQMPPRDHNPVSGNPGPLTPQPSRACKRLRVTISQLTRWRVTHCELWLCIWREGGLEAPPVVSL